MVLSLCVEHNIARWQIACVERNTARWFCVYGTLQHDIVCICVKRHTARWYCVSVTCKMVVCVCVCVKVDFSIEEKKG